MKEKNKAKPRIVIFLAVLLLAVIAFGVKKFCTFSAAFNNPDGSKLIYKDFMGSKIELPVPEMPEGYVFLYWKDEAGNRINGSNITLFENRNITADYSIALETKTHNPYLFTDETGMFRPYDLITRAETAEMFFSLLALPFDSEQTFIDITPEDDFYNAACALKELGVFAGERFHPGDSVTKGELLCMLSRFYTMPSENFLFSDVRADSEYYDACCLAAYYGWIESGETVKVDTGKEMMRWEAASLINLVLGRQIDSRSETKMDGAIPDIDPEGPEYSQMLEACISHEFGNKEGIEVWESWGSFRKLEEGYQFIGNRLSYVSADGTLLRDGYNDSLYFDKHGFYTSGNAEIDELVLNLFNDKLDDSMTRLEKLELMYQHCVTSYKYKKGEIYDPGETGWLETEALKMLRHGQGNCYSYAALFCEFARALGYDAEACSGYLTVLHEPHGWVEIELDSVTYLCDPEIDMLYYGQIGYSKLFMVDMSSIHGGYLKED